jgi:hypothetical protein
MIPLQRGFEGVKVSVSIPAKAPAVRMDRTLFLRGMLLLLSASAERAAASSEPVVKVTGSDEGGSLRIAPARIGVAEDLASTPRTWAGALPAGLEGRIEEVLAEAGGGLIRLDGSGESPEWDVRFPGVA